MLLQRLAPGSSQAKQQIPLRGHKVSMLTHTYEHKPPRNIEVTIFNHQDDSPFFVWPDVWSGELQIQKKYALIYGYTWHRISFLRPGVIKQHKPNQTKPQQQYLTFTIHNIKHV